MGINIMHSFAGERTSPYASQVPDRNPDPERFNVERTYTVGSYVCAMVDYVNCTNYEGKKILVFENSSDADIRSAKSIDPHFMDDGKIIARFRPDDEGWQDAIAYVERKSAR